MRVHTRQNYDLQTTDGHSIKYKVQKNDIVEDDDGFVEVSVKVIRAQHCPQVSVQERHSVIGETICPNDYVLEDFWASTDEMYRSQLVTYRFRHENVWGVCYDDHI
jgi:hypothetical protein